MGRFIKTSHSMTNQHAAGSDLYPSGRTYVVWVVDATFFRQSHFELTDGSNKRLLVLLRWMWPVR
jgi:hypothetical protein